MTVAVGSGAPKAVAEGSEPGSGSRNGPKRLRESVVSGSTSESTVHPRGQGKQIMEVAVGPEAPKAVAAGSGPGSGVGLVPEHVSDDDVYEEQPKMPTEYERQLSRIGKAELPDDQQGWYRPPNSSPPNSLAGGC